MNMKLHSKSGISLVEVIVATALLGIMVTAGFASLNAAHTMVVHMRSTQELNAKASGLIETLVSTVDHSDYTLNTTEIHAACDQIITEYTTADPSVTYQYTLSETGNKVAQDLSQKKTSEYEITVTLTGKYGTASFQGFGYPTGGLDE